MIRALKRTIFRFIHRLLKFFGLEILKINNHQSLRETDIVFLHIGKNAGTQLTKIFAQLSCANSIRKVGHNVKLKHLPEKCEYVFSVRDPVSRFCSGFYSRKRKGLPKFLSEWSEHEMEAFSRFEHANDLAESLFLDGEIGAAAMMAIQAISHTSMHQIDWFQGVANFHLRPPLAIIRQEFLREDLSFLLLQLGERMTVDDLEFTNDECGAHKFSYCGVPELSPLAISNLKTWYARDYEFYQFCEKWILTQKLRAVGRD